jgi:hypothetical protein
MTTWLIVFLILGVAILLVLLKIGDFLVEILQKNASHRQFMAMGFDDAVRDIRDSLGGLEYQLDEIAKTMRELIQSVDNLASPRMPPDDYPNL